jgi:hypothetical protein
MRQAQLWFFVNNRAERARGKTEALGGKELSLGEAQIGNAVTAIKSIVDRSIKGPQNDQRGYRGAPLIMALTKLRKWRAGRTA